MEVWTQISPDVAWSALFDFSAHALLLIDPSERRIVRANRRAEETYGYRAGELNGLGLAEILDPSDSTALARLTTPSTRHVFANGGRHVRSDSGTFYSRIHVAEMQGEAVRLILVSVIDPGENDLIDVASGLPDPRLFIDRLEQCVVHAHRSGRGLGVAIAIFPRLDDLLDALPVQETRRLLHDVGDRLKANLRGSDTVARVGRAEFALIVEGLAEESALLEVLRKVSADFEYDIKVGDEDMVVVPSFGVSVYPHDGHEADMLVDNAVAAAREALEAGRAQIRFFGERS